MRTFKHYSLSEFVEWIKRLSVTRKIDHVQIHHTWKPRKSDYQGERTIRGMWNYHVQVNGWNDIGQHLSIAPDGTIWDGRNFSADPKATMPAHVKSHRQALLLSFIPSTYHKYFFAPRTYPLS